MFGSYGWSKLLTEYPGEYERGVFDVPTGHPVGTAYSDYLKKLTRNPKEKHSALREQGWWKSEGRFLFEENFMLK
jgi:hypothetical protein